MNKIATTHLEIPRDFQIACEGFGIMVPDFMQLLVDHISYAYVFISDDSVNELATQAFLHAERVILDPQPLLKTNITLGKVAKESLPLIKKIVHLGMNKNYSRKIKKEKASKLVDKLYEVCSKEIAFKPCLYFDEETKIVLNNDFLLYCAIHQYTPTLMLNAYMRCVSLADLYARDHLDKIVPNPALAFYLKVRNAYGNLIDEKHINTLGFKNFLLDLQEFRFRYFTVRDLERRTALYRERFEHNFNQINQYNYGED